MYWPARMGVRSMSRREQPFQAPSYPESCAFVVRIPGVPLVVCVCVCHQEKLAELQARAGQCGEALGVQVLSL